MDWKWYPIGGFKRYLAQMFQPWLYAQCRLTDKCEGITHNRLNKQQNRISTLERKVKALEQALGVQND